MKSLIGSVVLFIVTFLLPLEIFLFSENVTHPYLIVATSAVLATIVVLLKKPVVHWHKMYFEDGYKENYKMKKYRDKQKRSGHSSGSGSIHRQNSQRQSQLA